MIDENGIIVDLGNDTGYDLGLVIESSNVVFIRLAF